jgi:type I restriction enzyme S subunit
MCGSTEYLHQYANGTTFQELPGGVLKELEFVFPTIEEQRSIALVLSTIDDKIESCTAVAKTIDDFFHSLWMVRFADLQDGPVGTLRDFCTAQYGVTVSGTTEFVGPRLLRVTDINKVNWVDWRNVPYCSMGDADLQKYQLHPGDCVVARMADPGKSAMIEVPTSAVFASYLIRIKPKVPSGNHFLFGYLKSKFFTDYADASSSGSVQQNINAQTILDAPCAMPSAEELAEFEMMACELRAPLVQAINERNSLLDLRGFLLPRLLSGELRVSEAEKQLDEAL